MSPDIHVPFTTAKHQVHCAKYSTSLDPRGYIPVFEYVVCEQPILWDRETGYVYWTGIWKAMGREKSEIAKLVDTNTELSCEVKKIRGGFLKIQGTWLPYQRAYELAIRTCWYIREDLEPVFGPTFLQEVLSPTHPNSMSRVPITLEERKNKAMESALSRQRAKILKSGMVSPPTTPKPYNENGTISPVKGNKRKRDLGTNVQKLRRNTNPDLNEHVFISIDDEVDPVMYTAGSYSNEPLLPPIRKAKLTNGKKSKYENFNHEFVDSPQQLGEAIYASLCLQRLSVDDGSRPCNEIVCAPPTSFVIGKHEFKYVDQQYRLAVKC